MESGLYIGTLRHRRWSPKKHDFDYPIFMAFLDIDRLPQLMDCSRLTSYQRWNCLSYFEGDHFGNPGHTLRDRLTADASRNGVTLPGGQIFLLTHLRYFGYVFNPVSFFYFFDVPGTLRLMLAEVNNTFGERCNYWLTPQFEKSSTAARRYTTAKRMHVSPFMSMSLQYDWICTQPDDRLVVHMNVRDAGAAIFDATLQLRRRPWSPREIRRTAIAYPLMAMRVTAAIHWQALKLWAKGVPVFPRPGKSPAGKVTDAPAASSISASAEEKVL